MPEPRASVLLQCLPEPSHFRVPQINISVCKNRDLKLEPFSSESVLQPSRAQHGRPRPGPPITIPVTVTVGQLKLELAAAVTVSNQSRVVPRPLNLSYQGSGPAGVALRLLVASGFKFGVVVSSCSAAGLRAIFSYRYTVTAARESAPSRHGE